MTFRPFIASLLIILLCLAGNGYAHQYDHNFYFETLYVDEGLHYDPIYHIIQDQPGLMWFGSADGLHRYDGYKFVSYRNRPFDSTSLPNNLVQSLFKDRQGQLWIGTARGGLALYNYQTDGFITFRFRNEQQTAIEAIAQGNEGTLWVASAAAGLFRVDTVRRQLIRCNTPELSSNLYSLYNHRHRVYAGGRGQLFLLKDDRIQAAYALQWNGRSFPDAAIKTICRDAEGNLWLGTAGHGIFVFDPAHKRFVSHYRLTYLSSDTASTNCPGVNAILTDRENNTWVLTQDNGIFLFNPRRKSFSNVVRDEYARGSLSDNRCQSIFEDRTGIIWIGTNNGINKYDRQLRKFNYYYHNPNDNSSLSDNYVVSVFEDQYKRLWVGTRKGYLNIVDRAKSTNRRILLKTHTQSAPVIAYNVYPLDSTTMLVATDAGLYEFNHIRNVFAPYPPFSGLKLRNEKIRYIVPYGKSHLLMVSDEGLIIHELATKRFTIFPLHPAPNETLDVKTVYIDPQQTIWIGTNNGLYTFDFKTHKFSPVPFSFSSSSINGLYIMSILRQGDQLWLGTYNLGLLLLDLGKKDAQGLPEVRQYTKVSGLANDVIYALMTDAENNLWMSTNKGISRLNRADSSFTNFDKSQGLQDDEFNRGAYFKSASGEMLMGGINGLNAFFPAAITPDKHLPGVVFTSLVILNRSLAGGKMHPQIPLPGKRLVHLPYHDNFIAIRFAAAHYSNPLRNEFYYKLENYDADWIYGGNSNQVTYTNLQPGEYVLKVRSVNPDGIHNEKYSSLHIHIEAPFWYRWWFFALVVSGIFMIIFMLINHRIRQDKRIQRMLERQIKERTREIVRQKEVIEGQNSDLQHSQEQLIQLNYKKDLLFSVLSHDLRSPLTTLEGFLTVLIQYHDVFTQEEVKTHAEKIKNTVSTSLEIIDNVLYWAQSQMGNITQKPVVLSLATLVEKTLSLYALIAENKNIRVTSSVDEKVCVYADENMMFVVIRNLISNALKFTPPGGEVRINTMPAGEGINFIVQDTGVGMDEESIRKLLQQNAMFSTKGTSNEKGTGLGFSLCKKFVELNEGAITVKSKVGEGSEFTVYLPITKTADSKPLTVDG